MTKCIVLGQEPTEVKKKPIEFVETLDPSGVFKKPISKPNEFEHIELICKSYSKVFDLIFAYDEDRHCGILFLGKWNDGVAE